MNRGKPNWEHLGEDLHVLITVEDAQNRASVRMKKAADEVRKLLVPLVRIRRITMHFIARQHAMHAERDIVLANLPCSLSVCLSLCPSHSHIVSKRMHISSNCNSHHLVWA